MATRRKSKEPTLADEIRDSGETTASAAETAARADREDYAFLAREFLTWLVWHAETQGGTFAGQGDVPDFSIQFGGRLTLHAGDGAVSEMVLKGASPGVSPDIRYALAGGLAVKEAELQLFVAGDEERGYMFTLSAEYFDLKRVQIPALLTEEDDDRADERLMLLGSLDAALELGFAQFLGERVRPTWTRTVVPALRTWLEEGT
ncbi:MAG TPA: hypothetical protein VHB97_15750 [Polyangia bacterium]|nr:hypothetical protein [Polyangia bacterium]